MGRDGITVNAVAPGFTITDMTRGTAERVWMDFDAMVAEQGRPDPGRARGRAG
jgi:3-oxoacyl-[acyl-carrier protein] reductase